MGGDDPTSSEHLSVLLQAYQYAEKVYSQCVTDVVNAEIRRDQAEQAKKEAFEKLEDARQRFSTSRHSSTTLKSKSFNHGNEQKTSPNQHNAAVSDTLKSPVKSKSFSVGQNRQFGKQHPFQTSQKNTVSSHTNVASLKPNRFHSPKRPSKSFGPVSSTNGPPAELGPGESVHSELTTVTNDTEKRSSKLRSASPKGTRASLRQSLKKAAQKQPQKNPSSSRSGGASVATAPPAVDNSKSPKQDSDHQPSKVVMTAASTAAATVESPTSDANKTSTSPTPSSSNATENGTTPEKSNTNASTSTNSGDRSGKNKLFNMFRQMEQKNMTSPRPEDPNLPPAFRRRSSAGLGSSSSSLNYNGGGSSSNFNYNGSTRGSSRTLPKSPPLAPKSPVESTGKEKVKANNDIPSLFSPTPSGHGTKRSLKKILARRIDFDKLDGSTNVLDICKGRSAEWMEQNLDCEKLGLVKKFYNASFGTRTSDKTQKVRVFTLVLNDENHDIVSTCAETLEFYVSTSSSSGSSNNGSGGGKPSLRERAADALVSPPQKDPIAVFAAPKTALKTSDIYYIGHWKVSDGKKLSPPKMVKGQNRRTHVKFQFVGVNPALVKAMNKGDDDVLDFESG